MTENQVINSKLTEARTELARARHHREAMAIAKARGELIEKRAVQRQASYIFVTLRQAILNFPSRYSRRMVGLKSEHQARQMLTKAAHEFLKELSGFSEKAIDPGWLARETDDSQAQNDAPATGTEIAREQEKAKVRRQKKAATMRKLRAAGRV